MKSLLHFSPIYGCLKFVVIFYIVVFIQIYLRLFLICGCFFNYKFKVVFYMWLFFYLVVFLPTHRVMYIQWWWIFCMDLCAIVLKTQCKSLEKKEFKFNALIWKAFRFCLVDVHILKIVPFKWIWRGDKKLYFFFNLNNLFITSLSRFEISW